MGFGSRAYTYRIDGLAGESNVRHLKDYLKRRNQCRLTYAYNSVEFSASTMAAVASCDPFSTSHMGPCMPYRVFDVSHLDEPSFVGERS
jgi:hypothetical protein